jgi:prevent-host-death family protein
MATWPWLYCQYEDGERREIQGPLLEDTRDPVVVTKRGRPVVTVVPYADPSARQRSLEGSVLKEKGSPYGTGERWDADVP